MKELMTMMGNDLII